jgi:hypothetical protein
VSCGDLCVVLVGDEGTVEPPPRQTRARYPVTGVSVQVDFKFPITPNQDLTQDSAAIAHMRGTYQGLCLRN